MNTNQQKMKMPPYEDEAFDRRLEQALNKSYSEAELDQTPKLLEAKRLLAKAIRTGVASKDQLVIKKVESYYPILGGFHYVFFTDNEKLLSILKASSLVVQRGCPHCVSSPCVLYKTFALSWRDNVIQYGGKPRTLDEIFDTVTTDEFGTKSRRFIQMEGFDCALDVLKKNNKKELPLCVSSYITDW